MDMDIEFTRPRLVEPGVKYFINQTLVSCAGFKKVYYNNIMNIGIISTIIILMCAVLYYKYNGKPTPTQKMLKEREKKRYILSRIKAYQDNKRSESQQNITGLPNWKNEYDVAR